ncbi:MAG: DNA-processing protein DprA [Desulfosarcinaceae bacterium]
MDALVPWMSLKSVEGIGNLLFRRLIDHFGSPEAVLAASRQELNRIEGVGVTLAKAISSHRTPDWIRPELKSVAAGGYSLLTQQDREFPELLLQIPDPPPVLYVYGSLAAYAPAVSVVGSRRATSYGLTTTRRLCEGLAAQGITVISGMARGIDTAAHEGALAGGGRTIAVLGTGLRHIYPAENLKLFHRIAENGAVITEFSMGAKPEAHHFPIRNRIISGMSLGTVVVEAAQRSGSLITARLAAEQNREVFAVPGNVNAPTTRGTHALIKQGAKLVQDVNDIVEELAAHLPIAPQERPPAKPGASGLTREEACVLEAIGAYPVHVDNLARQVQMEAGPLTAVLIQLERRGIIRQEPGHYFVRHIDYIEE